MQENTSITIKEQGIAIIYESHALSSVLKKAFNIKNANIATIQTIQQESSGANIPFVLEIEALGLFRFVIKSLTVTP